MGERAELLPTGTRLVHIGPHKTGSTALQWALHTNRGLLAEHGVHYAGAGPQIYRPAVGLTGLRGRLGAPKATIKDWEELVSEVDAAGEQRVVLSSESLANASTADIERLAADLGADRVHVVRMLRRYDKVLPSQWQQTVAGGGIRRYGRWLQAVLDAPGHHFWRRHGYGELTRRWAEVVGAENVTVVVVDETDRSWLLRVFEQLLGLPHGSLRLGAGHENRSFTSSEAELIRLINSSMRRRRWAAQTHHRFVRGAVTPALKRFDPVPGDPRVHTPEWALQRALAAAERGITEIESLGVRVVGDPQMLRFPTGADGTGADETTAGADETTAAQVSTDGTAAALARVAEVAAKRPLDRVTTPPPPTVDELSTSQLVRTIGGRVRSRLRTSRRAT